MNALREVAAGRYVTPFREGGSLPALVEADDDALYVAKFRGAGQGSLALVAEVIAGELARELGLPMPELVVVDLDAGLGKGEPDPEIQELLQNSIGANLGVAFLDAAETYSPDQGDPPSPELAAEIVWFDGLVANVDRTPRNPNLLHAGGRLNLIDHGAAIYHQHGGLDPERDASRPFPQLADHVLLPVAGSIAAAGERLRPRVTRELLAEVVGRVPAEWLADSPPEAYVEYLARRAEHPEIFTAGVERAHA